MRKIVSCVKSIQFSVNTLKWVHDTYMWSCHKIFTYVKWRQIVDMYLTFDNPAHSHQSVNSWQERQHAVIIKNSPRIQNWIDWIIVVYWGRVISTLGCSIPHPIQIPSNPNPIHLLEYVLQNILLVIRNNFRQIWISPPFQDGLLENSGAVLWEEGEDWGQRFREREAQVRRKLRNWPNWCRLWLPYWPAAAGKGEFMKERSSAIYTLCNIYSIYTLGSVTAGN